MAQISGFLFGNVNERGELEENYFEGEVRDRQIYPPSTPTPPLLDFIGILSTSGLYWIYSGFLFFSFLI